MRRILNFLNFITVCWWFSCHVIVIGGQGVPYPVVADHQQQQPPSTKHIELECMKKCPDQVSYQPSAVSHFASRLSRISRLQNITIIMMEVIFSVHKHSINTCFHVWSV